MAAADLSDGLPSGLTGAGWDHGPAPRQMLRASGHFFHKLLEAQS
jgi:hypothetical protein